MVFAQDSSHGKLGEKRDLAETIASAPLQQDKEFAMSAIQYRQLKCVNLLEYQSILRMIREMRHHNAGCRDTVGTYLSDLNGTFGVLKLTPDELIDTCRAMDIEGLMNLAMKLDDAWLNALNAPGTRVRKLAVLKKFLTSNGIFNARLIKIDISSFPIFREDLPTKEICQEVLDSCRNNRERLLVSLLIESLQRIGTISQLTWGDMLPHLKEDVFLVWIGPDKTKCNISHWMPVGRLSSYYLRRYYKEVQGRVSADDFIMWKRITLVTVVARILKRAGVRGSRQGDGKNSRYPLHAHVFRKFGVTEMEDSGVNEQVIRFLMGQKRDTYSKWVSKKVRLLEIYRAAGPTLETPDGIKEITDFASSRGYNLDPKALQKRICHGIKCGELRVRQTGGESGCEPAEAKWEVGETVDDKLLQSIELPTSQTISPFFSLQNPGRYGDD